MKMLYNLDKGQNSIEYFNPTYQLHRALKSILEVINSSKPIFDKFFQEYDQSA